MKKIILITLSTLMLLAFATGCGCSNKNDKQDKIKSNTNEDVVKDQTLDVFSFTNTSLVYEKNTSVLTTVVTNNSNEKQMLKKFNIIVKDTEGNVIVTLPGYVGSYIDAKASTVITSSYAQDLTHAAKIEYEIVK